MVIGAESTGESQSWLELLRSAYLARRSGSLIFEGSGDEIYLRRGEVFVDRDGPLAEGLQGPVKKAAENPRPASDPIVRMSVADLTQRLLERCHGEPLVRWRQDGPGGVELLGPLPTVCMLLQGIAGHTDESALIRLLGGESAKLRNREATPALEQLPALEPEMTRALVLLERPSTLADLLRSGGDRAGLLRGLAQLWVVGLVDGGQVADPAKESLVSAKIVGRFLERIGESLEFQETELDLGEHRKKIADLLSKVGDLDHYELLGLEVDADEGSVPEAYERLAREVHPKHAARLGLVGKEDALRLLFEKATEAYLSLSDPVRRSSYNTMMGLHQKVEVDPERRDEEKKIMAKRNFIQGSSCLADMEYSMAVELLKEAARMDPRPEYFAALGQAQSKNPRWRRHAVESYRQALEGAPEDAGLYLALGKLLEDEERIDEARENYQKALDLMPDNVAASEALGRIGVSGSAPSAGGLRGILKRSKS